MSALVARQPLQPLPMSSIQRGSRRLSARLLEKDEAHHPTNGVLTNGRLDTTVSNVAGKKTHETVPANTRKRKMDYDEEDDGFTFARVKKQKPRAPATKSPLAPENGESERNQLGDRNNNLPEEKTDLPKKRRNKMSFSTPKLSEPGGMRRSKRLSNETAPSADSPRPKGHQKPKTENVTTKAERKQQDSDPELVPDTENPSTNVTEILGEDHSATRIALPFADTPVIRRNKAMREGKSGKGDRRSSLGLRGRRASSLIESGSSNALPHTEVEVKEFYKHIESESLPEPKRMRQLLTWCATRALGEKPVGTDFEDITVKQAARIIEEELLKDFANKSAMSDWFSREDVPRPEVPLVERPHPKNTQNMEKIKELEEQIRRLRAERDSLETLLRPPVIDITSDISPGIAQPDAIDKSLLSDSDAAVLSALGTTLASSANISRRLSSIGRSIGPTIDSFADGIHKMAQYRDAAENIANRTLSICADKLAEREREGRRRALQEDADGSPKTNLDLDSVLRGLSRIER